MPILLDPNKQFVNIQLYYVEEVKKHGNSVFHFIRSAQELEEWKKIKGYKTQEEFDQEKSLAGSQEKSPGMPVKASPDPNKVIQSIVTGWRRMTWKDQNVIFSRCLKTIPGADGNMHTELDTIQYRDLKLKTCLKKWDLKDEQGKEVPVTEDVIDILTPEVAQELINNFEQITEPTSDELKN